MANINNFESQRSWGSRSNSPRHLSGNFRGNQDGSPQVIGRGRTLNGNRQDIYKIDKTSSSLLNSGLGGEIVLSRIF